MDITERVFKLAREVRFYARSHPEIISRGARRPMTIVHAVDQKIRNLTPPQSTPPNSYNWWAGYHDALVGMNPGRPEDWVNRYPAPEDDGYRQLAAYVKVRLAAAVVEIIETDPDFEDFRGQMRAQAQTGGGFYHRESHLTI